MSTTCTNISRSRWSSAAAATRRRRSLATASPFASRHASRTAIPKDRCGHKIAEGIVLTYPRVASLKTASAFRAHLERSSIPLAFDEAIASGEESPLAQSITVGNTRIGNRFSILPMEGWDGTPDGEPTDLTRRRWRHFGISGAKLIWGGEAVAVRQDGRANPHQLLMTPATQSAIASLRDETINAHRERFGANADSDLWIGLQLTHSGRYARPSVH